MEITLYILGGGVALMTVIHSIKTIIETRRKFYTEYMKRKQNRLIK